MRQLVEKNIAEHELFVSGDRVLIGVSGGADSVTLGYVLHFLRKRLDISILLAHLHHSIRGDEADADRELVARLAARLNIPLTTCQRDVPALAEKRGVSLEMAAREARISFFERECRRLKANKVALAHNADDQAETIILRLARGTGTSGMGGIAPLQKLGELTIVRPMLEVRHEQAIDFLRSHGLEWREDPSNKELDFLRNRVRHRIIPMLEENLNPNVRAALCRAAEIFNAEDHYLDLSAKETLQTVYSEDNDSLDIGKLHKAHKALRRRVILAWLLQHDIDPSHIVFETVQSLEMLCRSEHGSKTIDIDGEWRAVRVYNQLLIERNPIPSPDIEPSYLAVPGKTVLPPLKLEIITKWDRGIVRESGGMIGRYPSQATLSAARVGEESITVRSWRSGDRMRPYGLAGQKKVQDIFTDQKVPEAKRKSIPLFECRGELVWIPGYRIAAGWEVPSPDAPCLHITATRTKRE